MDCPGRALSLALTVKGITATELAGVTSGSEIRGYKVATIRAYQDGAGAYWIGSQSQDKTTLAWSTIEPIAGPLSGGSGFQLGYYDAEGAITAARDRVARISIRVTGRSSEPVGGSGSARGYQAFSLLAQVALRGNERR